MCRGLTTDGDVSKLPRSAWDAGLATVDAALLAIGVVRARFETLGPAIERILLTSGRVLTTGIGKSALVAARFAATLSTTGTAAQFIHASDALHGEAGAVCTGDLLVCFSRSGETGEVCQLAGLAQKRGVPVVAIVSGLECSSLESISSVVVNLGPLAEGDPANVVPTSTAAAMGVVADAIAVAVMVAKGHGLEEYGLNHPAGSHL